MGATQSHYMGSGSGINWGAEGASRGASFVPVIGDALGVATAILGFDPITSKPVYGVFRWLGLLGVIGLAEVAATARAGQAGVKGAALAAREFNAGRALIKDCLNSFTAKTKVWVARAAMDVAKVSTAGQPAARASSAVKGVTKTALATIAISTVAIGTPVLAFNEATQQQEVQPVTVTISHGKNDQPVVTLTLEASNGEREILETTPEHPFAVRVGQDGQIAWVNAIDLTKGQSIARADGRSGRLISRTVEARDMQMYNLSVARAHTYYVGDGQWLVHNCDSKVFAQFLENVYGIDSVRRLRRHGSETTLEQQQFRARTGYTPDGLQGSAGNATRFLDNADLVSAYHQAIAMHKPGQLFVDIPFSNVVGEGFYQGGREYATTNIIRVQFTPDGKIVSGYPVLPKR